MRLENIKEEDFGSPTVADRKMPAVTTTNSDDNSGSESEVYLATSRPITSDDESMVDSSAVDTIEGIMQYFNCKKCL